MADLSLNPGFKKRVCALDPDSKEKWWKEDYGATRLHGEALSLSVPGVHMFLAL